MIEITCPRCAHLFKSEEESILSDDEFIVEDNCPVCGEYIVFLINNDRIIDYK